MTRIPELERQLVSAASRRRRIVLPRIRWGVLVPIAAAVLIGLAFVRVDDPEIEAPPRPAQPPSALEDLRRGPLAVVLDAADPKVVPVSLRVGPWTVAAWGEPGGMVCQGATTRPDTAGRGCSSAGLTAAALEDDGGSAEMLSDDGQQLVYGLAAPDVEKIEVAVGDLVREAKLSGGFLTTVVTEEERRAVEVDGGEVPPAGPVKFRLFAASFPDDPSVTNARLSVTRADGRTATVAIPAAVPRESAVPSVGCYREATLDTDVAVPGGEGPPVQICERFWAQTGFDETPKPQQLTACREKGADAASVFPGGPEVCRRLGLEPYR